MESKVQKKKLGILGDGQLAQMLVEAAHLLGVEPLVFTPHEQTPAATVAKHKVIGKVDHPEELKNFLSQVDVVAFENEFLDTRLLQNAARDLKAKFLPSLEVLEQLQDKLNQKILFQNFSIATAHWVPLQKNSQEEIQDLFLKYPKGFVLKWSRMGYDGKGILIVSEANSDSLARIQDFIQEGLKRGAKVYAEEKIDFEQEVAIIALRSQNGEMLYYPLVHSNQLSGICKKVWGPSVKFGISEKREEEAQSYAKKVAEKLGIVGVFALEMFVTKDGKLLVNEAAPRVHNSGHYTQDACQVSQFENHVRALLGLPLGSTKTEKCFAMLNLLGPEEGIYESPPYEVKKQGNVFLHWYGKKEIRPLRKVGHLNTVFENNIDLADRWKEMESLERTWFQKNKK